MPSETWDTVQDKELIEWLRSGKEEERELIVQAKTPQRNVAVTRRADGRTLFLPGEGTEPAAREEAIIKLTKALEQLVEESPVILKSAGAVIVRATRLQALSFVDHPLVKAIYPNRRVGKKALQRQR